MEQFLSAKFLSGRNANLKTGIVGVTTNDKVLEVVGRVGIGSTIFEPSVDLDVRGSVTIRDTLIVDGINVGSAVGSASTLGITSVTQLRVSGVSTFVGFSTFNDSVNIEDDLFVGRNAKVVGITTLGVTTVTELTTQSINSSGIITGSTFRPSSGYIQSPNGTNSFYIYDGTGNVAFQGTIGASQVNNASGNKVIGFAGTNNATFENNVFVSGVTTAAGGFVGNLTGIAASATRLVTPRTFEITGDVVASAISFDGTGNVSLAATIQPNSVALGGDTTGDYVQTITGTSNQITVTGGTGESSTPTLSIPNQFTAPQDVTVTRDLQVNRNLNVTGNITIGGTSATLFTTELKVADPDIVLGFRTDAFGNDISNDNTANHGGVALASTEGTPLVPLFIAGIETNPATYKKIMWFKSGTFSGLGTDAWLINYAVGIGSTQFPTGTRLAAGSVQFTQNDLAVVRNINASGITTSSGGFVGNLTGTASSATYSVVAGIATYAPTSGLSTYAVTSGIATYAVTAGIATYTPVAGLSTYSVRAGIATLAGNAGFATVAGIATYAPVAGLSTYAVASGIATYAITSGITTYAITAGIATYAIYAGIATYAPTAGFSTFAGYSTVAGIATYTPTAGLSTYAVTAGIATYAPTAGLSTYAVTAGIATYAPTAGVSTSVIGGIGSITQLNVSGISTFAGVATHTAALFGTTANFSGVVTAASFNGNASSATYAPVAGLSTYAITAGIATYAPTAGLSTYAVTAGIATYAPTAGFSTAAGFATVAGIATYTPVSGLSTYAVTSGIATYAPTAGIATYAVRAGIATLAGNAGFATVAGIATYATVTGIATYAPTAGIATYAPTAGIATYAPTAGFSTAAGFATVAGIATYAPTAGIATYAPTAGFSTAAGFATVAGIATYATVAGFSTYTLRAGIATYAPTAGIASELTSTSSVNTTGIITASQFSTGSGTLGFTTNTISGPSEIVIDPSPVGVGTTSGVVRIRGDLYVDGTQFVVNSSTIELADLNVGIATTVGTNALLDGGGIGIGSANIRKTITWNNTAGALTSSEDWNLVSGKQYEINGTSVLNSTTLGSGVVNSSLTSVGTLGQLNVTGVSTLGTVRISSGIVTATSGVVTYYGDGSKLTDIQASSIIGVAPYAQSSGIATYAISAGIATYAVTSGIATYAPVAGLSTYAVRAGIATLAGNAGFATVAGIATYATVAGIATYAPTAGISTNLKGGSGGTLVYQSATDTTAFLANGSVGQILQSNGGTSAPSWVPSTSVGAISGITVNDEGTIVGGANSTSQLNFVGNIVSAAATAGIATITFGDYITASGIATYALTSGIATYAPTAGLSTYTLRAGIATYAPTAGLSTYAVTAGIATYAPTAGFSTSSGFATVAGIATYAPTAGLSTYAVTSGIATYAPTAGIATYAPTSGISTNLKGGSGGTLVYQSATDTTAFLANGSSGQILQSNGGTSAPSWVNAAPSNAITGLTIRDEGTIISGINSVSQLNFIGNIVSVASTLGIATITLGDYITAAGIATYSLTAGLSTYAVTSGIATYAPTAGIATYAVRAGIATLAGNAGFATVAGIATYAPTAGVATALQNARNFSITGSFVTATAISFNGTGDVALAATITADSIGLGTYTSGDYVKNVNGTANQITVTSGTGEGSSPTLSIPSQFTAPQDVTVTRDLQVNRNLNVNGNITIGGTSATIFASTLSISDPDIVLGFRTDGSGNDISNDNTANHGGVALASTEGSPLVPLFIAGIETNPATYKKIMWFKSGTFSGLGTDAWLINYAVGIGSTQFPTGTRLAAGSVQFTENDLAVVRNINASGITTSSGGFVGNLTGTASSATYAPVAGLSTYAVRAGIATNLAGGSGGTLVYQSATDTTAFLANGSSGQILQSNGGTSAPSWVNAAPAGAITGLTIRDEGAIVGGANSVSQLNFIGNIVSVASTLGIATITLGDYITAAGIATYSLTAGIATYAPTAGLSTYAVTAGIATYAPTAGIATYAVRAGIATLAGNAGFATVAGIATYAPTAGLSTYAVSAGIATYAITSGISTYTITAGIATYALTAGIATYAPTAGVSTSVSGGTGSLTQLQVTGISTFTNGPVFIGAATSTGTANQDLQVTGGAYISTSTGIGTTNPLQTLHIQGNLLVAAGSATTQHIVQKAYEVNNGTLSWEGSAGQLFSITNNLTSGSIFSVNDVSGIPSVDVNADGTVTLAPYADGNVGIATTRPTSRLHVIGDGNFTGVVTASSFSGNASSATYAVTAGIATYAPTAGIATYAVTAGIATYAPTAGLSTYAVTAGIATYAPTAGLSTYAVTAGIATLAGNAGFSTVAGIATFASVAGLSTYAVTAGIATYASTAGLSTYAVTAGIATYAPTAGLSTYAVTAGIATYAPTAGIASALTSTASVNTTGIITAAQFSTGSGTLGFTTNTISGPSEIVIDPSPVGVGTTSGVVRIRGDLYVDGTQFVVNSTTIELADLRVGIATTVGTNTLLDGGGIGIGSANIVKTITWNNTASALTSSEDWNLVSGKQYEINGTSVLTSTTLGSGVVNSSLTSVGTLGQLNVTGVVTAASFSGNASSATYAPVAGLSTYAVTAGIATYAPTAGLSTYAVTAGIATYAPTAGLSTYAPVAGLSTYAVTAGIATYAPTAGVSTSVSGGAGSLTQLQVTGISTFTNGPVFIGAATSTGTANQRLQVTDNAYVSGNLGVGITNSTAKLHVVGNTFVTGVVTATDFNSASDARLKTNIQPIANPIATVEQLQGVSFNWIENNKPSMGVIADELQKVLPELVTDTDPKTVNYNGLIGLLIEVVKEQQVKIESLENRISKLE